MVVSTESVAQVATSASDPFAGQCVAIRPAADAVYPRRTALGFARLDSAASRVNPQHRVLRVAVPEGMRVDPALRRFGRLANWYVDGDSLRLMFSTGFTVLHFAFAATRADTLRGNVWILNDNGPTTTYGGLATLAMHPCARLVVQDSAP